MIEATCPACGTVNRVAAPDLPAGARFVTCASCKARVALATKTSQAIELDLEGELDLAELSDLPAPRAKQPAAPAPAVTSRRTLDDLDLDSLGDHDLVDVGAPLSSPSLGPVVSDLPAPRAAAPRPEPARAEVSDLPAPKASRASEPATARSGSSKAVVSDLPAPKPKTSPIPRIAAMPAMPAMPPAPPSVPPSLSTSARPPATPASRTAVSDLPAPKSSVLGDLPTPRRTPDLPAPKPAARPAVPDLPTPVRRTDPLADLPAPVLGGGGLADLPMPKPGAAHDLLAPKGLFDDLPQPARGGGPELPVPKGLFDDLPQPARGGEPGLPAPKGFFEDLPQPAKPGSTDLPAPKGFFEDLPQPAKPGSPELPAPKGFFEDLPQRANPNRHEAEVPAPKGFFEDLPQRANPNRHEAEVPAPKGFFEDLPQRANPNRHEAEVPAPKGFFDDLPQRANPARPELPAPKGFFDDLPGPAREPERPRTESFPLVDLSPGAAPTIELPTADEVELGATGQFDDLDLSSPSADAGERGGGDGIHFAAKPSGGPSMRLGAADAPPPPPMLRTSAAELALDIDDAPPPPAPSRPLATKRRAETLDAISADVRRKKRLRLAGIALAGAAVLGGGGFVLYRRHAAQVERQDTIATQLGVARTAFASASWSRAASAAKKVLEIDPAHAEALGLAAESLFADGLGHGTAAASRFTQGRKLLATALKAKLASPTLERAQVLSAITANQAERALPRLQQLIAGAPKDPVLALYLGWLQAARGDSPAAIEAYTTALTAAASAGAAGKPISVLALYGRARSKLANNDLPGARTDFSAVLDQSKDHIAAQVGLAAALPPAQVQQQESDLLAILQRKDLAAGDPRAVVEAWTLAAEAAARSGRIDVARERYRKALALGPNDVDALTGLAELELADGKIEVANETISKALTLATEDVRAQLIASEISIAQKRFDDATTRLRALATRNPPPPRVERARLKMVTGKLLEAQGEDDEAANEYVEAAKLAGDIDLTPALTAVSKLGALATAATDPIKAAELRTRADGLMEQLAKGADQDPQLALTLGIAYVQANDPAKAEPWLRRVVDARPNEADPLYQLAKALGKLGRHDEAIERLTRALDLEPGKIEIGLELARMYEQSSRDQAAGELYAKLLATKEPPLELRARAGRFFARTAQIEKAAEQGTAILAAAPDHPAGLYLKGEGLLLANKPDDAAKLFRQAVDADRDPQYLDAQGRAAEAQVLANNDTKFQDVALRAYMSAVELAPTLFNPYAGQGRLYVARREAAKAIPPLLAANKLRPEDAQVAQLIGLAYKELQEKKVAIEWLARAYRLEPNADTAWNLGQLYNEANQPQQAIGAYANATRLALDIEQKQGREIGWTTEALYQLGRVNYDAGNEAAAKGAWEKFVARNPKPGAKLDEVRRELATTLQRY